MNLTINYLAVLVAAIAAVVLNALWYNVILKGRVDALRAADPTIAGRQPAPPMYAVAIVGQILMAFVIAVVLELISLSGIGAGVIVGAMLWLGFTITSMAQVQIFGYRQPGFVLVDGAIWLINAVVMGAILAAWV